MSYPQLYPGPGVMRVMKAKLFIVVITALAAGALSIYSHPRHAAQVPAPVKTNSPPAKRLPPPRQAPARTAIAAAPAMFRAQA